MGTGLAFGGATMKRKIARQVGITSALVAADLLLVIQSEPCLSNRNENSKGSYVMAMGTRTMENRAAKPANAYLEEILHNTEKSVAKLEQIESHLKQPSWYAGFIGYLLAVGIGVGSLFGVDMYRRYRTATAYNKTGENYFVNDQLHFSLISFENALTVDPGNHGSRYNLVETLIKLEDDMTQSGTKADYGEHEVDKIAKRLTVEIDMLKRYGKEDFVPFMLEGIWLQMKGKRAKDESTKACLFESSLESYLQAIKIYKTSDSYYPKEIIARLFGRGDQKLNQLYRSIGTLEKDRGNLNEAIVYFIRALRFNKEDQETLVLLKQCLEEKNRHKP
jgi:tetratricopeptide (TPR) repeat protein